MSAVCARKEEKKTAYQGRRFSWNWAVGDYVVHESHGLGIYRGIEKLNKIKSSRIILNRVSGRREPSPATKARRIKAGADANSQKLFVAQPSGHME